VEEVLLEHPAVAEAAAFAVQHVTLGEDVGAAVVLRDSSATPRELRDLAFAHLADYKVPSEIRIVNKIPKGPTGKLERGTLAKVLDFEASAPYVAPQSDVEGVLVRLWNETLSSPRIGANDNFFLSGGDSLSAARLIARVRAVFGVELPLPTVFREPTVAEAARRLDSQ
jgi:acyl carrier protein